jgi:hypothetical protein
LSQDTQKMSANDKEQLLSSTGLTQESQKSAIGNLYKLDSNLSKNHQKGMSIIKGTMEKIRTHPDLVDRYLLQLHELNVKYTNIVTANGGNSVNKKECNSMEKCSSKKRGSSLITAATEKSTLDTEKWPKHVEDSSNLYFK